MADDQPRGEPPRLMGLLKDLSALAAGLGIILYGALYALYSSFYSTFGVTPEEVGFSYSNIFVRSLGLLALFAVAFTPGLLLWNIRLESYIKSLSIHDLDSASRQDSERIEGKNPNLAILLRRTRKVVAIILLILSPYLLFRTYFPVSTILDYRMLQIRLGWGNRSSSVGPLKALDIAVSPVQITWTTNATPEQKALQVHRLLYLGQSGGIAVVFNINSEQTIRVPLGAAVLRMSNCLLHESPLETDPACKEDGSISVDLTGADISGVDLHNEQLDIVNPPILEGANLEGANMRSTKVGFANFREANLQSAQLQWALLSGSDMREVNLKSALLQRSGLYGVDLRGANLQGANLDGAVLFDAKLHGAISRVHHYVAQDSWVRRLTKRPHGRRGSPLRLRV